LFATLTAIVLGGTLIIGLPLLEAFSQQLGGGRPAVGWSDPSIFSFFAAGFIGLLLVLVVWFVSAPIRKDKRQEFRR
jgi:hypothetical protein